MAIKLDRDKELCIVRLEGELNISCASELKHALLDAMASCKKLKIDLMRATGVDITAIQLLWAAQREAAKREIVVTLAGAAPECICDAVREAGFEKFLLFGAPHQQSGSLQPVATRERDPE